MAAGQEQEETGNQPTSDANGKQAVAVISPDKLEEEAAKNGEETEEERREKEIQKTYKVPLSRLMSFCRPEWCLIVPGLLAALASGSTFPLGGAFALVEGMVAFINPDKEVMKRETEKAAIWFTAMGLTRFFAVLTYYTCFGMIAEGMTKRCRQAMLETMCRQEIGFHDNPEHTPGRLSHLLQLCTYRVQTFVIAVGDSADGMCAVIVGVTLSFYYSWEMALTALGGMPLFAIADAIQTAVVLGTATKANKNAKLAQQVVSDAIGNVRTVQASNCEKDLLQLYSDILAPPPFRKQALAFLAGGFGFGLSQAATFWIISAEFWIMGIIIENGRGDFYNCQKAFVGTLWAAFGLSSALMMTRDMNKAKVAAHDMFQLLDRKSQIDGLEPTGVTPADPNMKLGHFEFTDVKFFYPFRPNVQVLKGVTFTVKEGQSVGVVGPSGGGKSTVMALIQRFYDPQSGQVFIGEGSGKVALDSLNIRWWRRQVGYVGQEPVLFNTTVLENVKYGLQDGEVSEKHLNDCKAMANLSFLDGEHGQGWETRVGPKGGRLSGGQKQRVAICRALARSPPVLLFDEATSALDSNSERKVQKAIEEACRGRTSFSIAHRLSTIQGCDVIIVVADGRIVEQGSHEELMSLDGVYRKLQAQSSSAKSASPLAPRSPATS
uniref:Bile salt export pump n=1 Tax=Alexandrium monilatum TaxID=311494 RepID=A0A7S4QNS6_9DINO